MKVKSEHYSYSNAKSQSYDSLNDRMRQLDQQADRDIAIKKINSSIIAFRKQLNKVINSEYKLHAQPIFLKQNK